MRFSFMSSHAHKGHDIGCPWSQASGVKVQSECATLFQEMKLKHKYRYILFGMTVDFKEICVLKSANPDATYDQFLEDLSVAEAAKECRYGVYDAEYELPNKQKRNKLVFVLWAPEDASVKQKMLYTSSKDAIKKALVGIGKELQATDMEEASWSYIMELCLRTEHGCQ